jgi:hypothetical protein
MGRLPRYWCVCGDTGMNLRIRLLDWLIRYVEREVTKYPVKPFDEKKKAIFFENLWEMPGFREYYRERNEQIKNALANGITTVEGVPLELPTRTYIRVWAQRAENALLAGKALSAWKKAQEKRKTK